MSRNIRSMKVVGDETEFLLVASSSTGRETILCIGEWGGATIEVQTSISVDNDVSKVTTFPSGATHTENFSIEVTVGYKQPIYITVSNSNTGDDATELYIRSVPSER